MGSSTGKKVLIYRLGSLGDTVMALPCFHRVRKSFPDAHITILTNRPIMAKAAPLQAVLAPGYFYDNILHYPVGTRSIKVLFDLIKQIRALEIDTVVNLTATRSKTSGIRDWLFFKAAGVKRLVGFSPPASQPESDKISDLATWEAKNLADQISELGAFALNSDEYWDLKLSKDEEFVAQNLVGAWGAGSQMLAISTGTKLQANDWGADNWKNLIKELKLKLPNWKLLVVGAAEEAKLADDFIQLWGDNGLNLCGKTSPRVSAAVLKKTNIFIGHDSGPIHLAACVGVPCIGIFSARNPPGKWYPRGIHNTIIYHRPECWGCGLEVCEVQQKKCILSITTSEVIQCVDKVLSVSVAERKSA